VLRLFYNIKSCGWKCWCCSFSCIQSCSCRELQSIPEEWNLRCARVKRIPINGIRDLVGRLKNIIGCRALNSPRPGAGNWYWMVWSGAKTMGQFEQLNCVAERSMRKLRYYYNDPGRKIWRTLQQCRACKRKTFILPEKMPNGCCPKWMQRSFRFHNFYIVLVSNGKVASKYVSGVVSCLIVHGAHRRLIDVSANVDATMSVLGHPVVPRRASSAT
jgi:hypothetical protein